MYLQNFNKKCMYVTASISVGLVTWVGRGDAP